MSPSSILIIDDDEEVAMMLSSYLQALGYDAAYALNRPDADEKLRAKKRDLLLMDFRMPGSSGFQMYQELQAAPQSTGLPVIFVSAISPEEAGKTIPQSPWIRFIKKPVDVKLLQKLIQELLPNKSSPSKPS